MIYGQIWVHLRLVRRSKNSWMGKIPVLQSELGLRHVCERETGTKILRERWQTSKRDRECKNLYCRKWSSTKRNRWCVSSKKGTSFKNSRSSDKGPGAEVPKLFLALGTSFVEDNFHGWRVMVFRMTQAHHMFHALYSYYCYISSTSHHQALDLGGGWGALRSNTAIHVL